MGKPNDFLGLLYLTFDYLCQLLTLVHVIELQHSVYYICECSCARLVIILGIKIALCYLFWTLEMFLSAMQDISPKY